jgi:hypothetical protein
MCDEEQIEQQFVLKTKQNRGTKPKTNSNQILSKMDQLVYVYIYTAIDAMHASHVNQEK